MRCASIRVASSRWCILLAIHASISHSTHPTERRPVWMRRGNCPWASRFNNCWSEKPTRASTFRLAQNAQAGWTFEDGA